MMYFFFSSLAYLYCETLWLNKINLQCRSKIGFICDANLVSYVAWVCQGWPCSSLHKETATLTSGYWLLTFPLSALYETWWNLLGLPSQVNSGSQCVLGQGCAWEWLCRANWNGIWMLLSLWSSLVQRLWAGQCTPGPGLGSSGPQSAGVWACPLPSGAIMEVQLPWGSGYENYLKHVSGAILLYFFLHSKATSLRKSDSFLATPAVAGKGPRVSTCANKSRTLPVTHLIDEVYKMF